jgi:transcriptional regulator NrdR family protein
MMRMCNSCGHRTGVFERLALPCAAVFTRAGR